MKNRTAIKILLSLIVFLFLQMILQPVRETQNRKLLQKKWLRSEEVHKQIGELKTIRERYKKQNR